MDAPAHLMHCEPPHHPPTTTTLPQHRCGGSRPTILFGPGQSDAISHYRMRPGKLRSFLNIAFLAYYCARVHLLDQGPPPPTLPIP